jgi:hypothetical protein
MLFFKINFPPKMENNVDLGLKLQLLRKKNDYNIGLKENTNCNEKL